jgi:hypothetical protein
MQESNTPRPNVVSGAVIGFVIQLLGMLLLALQLRPTSLDAWLVALQPLVGAVVAFFAPAYTKAWAALIGAGLIPFIVLIINVLSGKEALDAVVLLTLAIALVQAAVTALVPNTKTN